MKKDKITFCIIIALVLVGLLVWGILLWLVWEKQKPVEVVESTEKVFTTNDLELLKRSLTSSKSRIELVKGQFVEREMSIKFIEQIEGAARQAGVSLKINGAQDNPDVVINFTGEGSFGGLMQFQLLLENLPRKIFFNKVSIYKKVTTETVENWLMEASVKLTSVN